MILSLSLKNWRSHKESNFKFSPGVNFLTGIMGAGKSSVMEALCFGLFGSFPQGGRGRVKLEELGGEGKETEVSLVFEAGGQEYLVERRIGKSSSAGIRKGGSLLCVGPKKVNGLVEEILGVDYELFTRAVYSEQNRMDYLLSLDPGRRKIEIDELLGLDKFEKARAGANSLANIYGKQKEEAERGFDARKLGEERGRLGGKKKELEGLEGKLLGLEKKIGDARREAKEREEKLEGLKKKRDEYRKAEAELLRGRGRLEGLKKEFSSGKYAEFEGVGKTGLEGKPKEEDSGFEGIGKEELEGELKEAGNAVLGQEKILQGLEKSLNSALVEVSSLERIFLEEKRKEGKRKEAQDGLGKILGGEGIGWIKKIIVDKTVEEGNLSALIGGLQARTQELSKSLSVSLGEGGKCPVCMAPLSPEHARKMEKERREELSRLALEMEGAKKQKEGIRKEALGLREKEEKAQKLLASLEALGKGEDLEILSEKIGKKKEEEKDLLGRLGECKEKVAKLRKGGEEAREKLKAFLEMEGKKKEILLVEKEIERLYGILSGIDYSEERLEEEAGKLNSCLLSLKEIENEQKFGREKAGELSELILEISGFVGKMEEAERRVSEAQEAQNLANILKNCLSLAQRDLRAEYIDSINETMGLVWPVIYPYGDYGRIRVRADEKDYYFEMLAGEWKPFDGFASGGERACLSLALRIAVASVLAPKMSMLILDEPTHNLDENAISKFGSSVLSELPKLTAQCFIITHERRLAEAGFGSVYLLSRDKEKGEPTLVEKMGKEEAGILA